MQKTTLERPAIKLVGLSTRTNNRTEIDAATGKILPLIQRYFHQALSDLIPHRVKKGTTYCAYTDYESDHLGDYTYFVGEEVSSFDSTPPTFQTLLIPAQTYTVFTCGPGSMPDVIRKPWFEIWQMTEQALGGKRTYKTDFELYDERAQDHQNIIVDIYIGIH